MGTRDFRWREKKKPKKDAKKSAIIPQLTQPVEVEVVKRHRKKEEESPEE
ncbi:MAG: hypothetical protein AB1603_08615 [Chloroflexota bacterium]